MLASSSAPAALRPRGFLPRGPALAPAPLVASTSGRGRPAGSSANGSSSTDPVEQLKGKFDAFVKDASPKVASAAEDLMGSAKRAASRLDAEYEISYKAEKTVKKAKEAAKDVDTQYGIRRRLRSMQEDFARHYPAWKRAFDEFSVTPLGKFTIIAGIVSIMTTSIFWKVRGRALRRAYMHLCMGSELTDPLPCILARRCSTGSSSSGGWPSRSSPS